MPRLYMAVLLSLVGCAESPSVFNPGGPAAERIADLGWRIFGLGAAVYVVVMGYLCLGLFRRRREETRHETQNDRARLAVIIGGVVLPAIILLVVFGFSINVLGALPYPEADQVLTVEVIGHQWWWEVRYPDYDFVTANEIRIPVGQPVEIQLCVHAVDCRQPAART